MLESLYIRNFILIDKLNIDFNEGFSAFTGETGAGKSIFIDSIACLCGDKMTTSMIKKGADKAIIEGTFSVSDKTAAMLQEAGYDSDTLIISREINTAGKGTTRVNQRSASVSFVKALLSDIVDIHSQHDSQYLLNEKYHLSLLDRYCQMPEQLENLADLYHKYHNLEKEYNELCNTTYNEAEIEIIRYQLDEIKKLKITDVHEDTQIEEKLKLAKKQEKLQQVINDVKVLFSDDGILDKLYMFKKLSGQLEDIDSIAENISSINDSYYSIADQYESMIDQLSSIQIDESELDQLNARLFELQRCKRKYGKNLEELVGYTDELHQQIDSFNNREFILDGMKKKLDKAFDEYLKAARTVSAIRKEKAIELQNAILAQLKDLALEKARFAVDFTEGVHSSKGFDNVRFLVAVNTGTDLQPLNKVASGGELSRFMLGLKAIFASLQGTELIIFDEIDTGISGYVALNIGVKMHHLSDKMQVFSVTHLPSVSACADSQYLISKYQSDDATETTVQLLEGRSREEQIAILSSSSITENSLQAARELLALAERECSK